MRAPHRPVDKRPDLPALERRVLERWRAGRIFERSLAARRDGPIFSFSEGPPTANGNPGAHHVLLRSFKDFFMRYRTMRGYRVPRKAGWDCHGLPVELEVEKALGLNSKREIEDYGVAEFNARCRESNQHYIRAWERMTERIGFWIDLDGAFQTGTPEYIESVWWSLHELWDKGLVYQGHKVVPYCPRCGTGLSSHETAMGYRDVVDETVTVKLPVTERRGPLQEGDALLIWTTMPWTLFANCAVAIDPRIAYVRARLGDEVLVLAADRVEAVLGDLDGEVEVLDRFPGSAIVDARYAPPFDLLPDHGPKGHAVLAADHVTIDKGTGLVHTAKAFGEEDFVLCERHGIPLVNPVRPDGTYDERIVGYEGEFVLDANPRVIADLRAAGRLLRSDPLRHSYPHCWRCESRLLWYATESWYIATRDQRHRMLAQNQRIDWRPEHVRDGRFGNWLQGNVDWALSRDRYWGTPLPIWECDACGARHCIGSLAELRELAGRLPEDLHRPWIDAVTWPCHVHGCGGTMRRVSATIDTWYDSACMPFAQFHYPFEGEREFAEQFPPTFICEGIDQTRGWFYTSLAVSTLLFDDIPFRTAVCMGHVQDAEGHKMSKSRGNAVDPWDVLERHGADAFRWYYLASQQPWQGYRFSVEAVEEAVRLVLLPLWTTYGFYVLYANIERFDPDDPDVPPVAQRPALDRWALSRLQGVIARMRDCIDDFDAHGATQAAAAWIDDLSNWYVRLSRRAFWNGERHALATLRTCLVETAKALAPAIPFMTEEIYANLVGGADWDFGDEPESVHLCDYPEPDAALVDEALEHDMALVREAIELGRDARARSRMKVRQPLPRAIVCSADPRARAAVGRLRELIERELNVKAVEVVDEEAQLLEPVVLPNLQRLGPRCGRDMPAVAAQLRGRPGAEALAALEEHGVVSVTVGEPGDRLDPPRTYALAENDLVVRQEPRPGLVLSRRGELVVAIDTTLDEPLRREGLAREIVRVVQAARRRAGVAVTDRIELTLGGAPELLAAAREHQAYLAEETLATTVVYDGDGAGGERVEVEGLPLAVALAVADRATTNA